MPVIEHVESVTSSNLDESQLIMIACRRIVLGRDEMNRVESFCKKIQHKQSLKGSRDMQRNDVGKHRIINGLIGKLGEVGAAKCFGGVVDFRVWKTGARGLDQFEPDLALNEGAHRFHVKTCHMKHTQRTPKGVFPKTTASWTIDENDPMMTHPDKQDIIILMFASDEGSVCYLGWVHATHMQGFWRPCLSQALSHKRAVYIRDIWKHIHQQPFKENVHDDMKKNANVE